MGYTIKNSANGNDFFTANGSAITSSRTQVNVKGSTLNGVLDSSIPAKDNGLVSSVPTKYYTGFDNRSILRGYTTKLAEDTLTAIQINGNPGIHPSILKQNSVRTVKAATAVRNGYWNPVSGQFQTTGGRVYPGVANDITAMGIDSESTVNKAVGGAHNYNYGGVPATGLRYNPRTQ